MFAFLEGISPIWWLALALVLGVFELLAVSTYFLWPALAAGLVAASLIVWPELTGEVQLAVFAACTVATTLAGRWAFSRFGNADDKAADLNNRAARMVGRNAEVISYANSRGYVLIDGVRWSAIWPDGSVAEEGDTVKIEGVDGSTLLVSRN